MLFTKEYWNNRAKNFGHTGHSEPFYYCFDQQARLFAINSILEKTIPKASGTQKAKALDFGCGSGDFVELLSKHYTTVFGYDISETVIKQTQLRFKQSNIIISDKLADLTNENKFDLILTVTVLQTFTREELEKMIVSLSQLLSEGGKIIAMEFFSTHEYNRQSNENRTTNNDWHKVLANTNLKISSTSHFYNSVHFPSKSWLEYNNRFFLKLLKPFKRFWFVQNYFRKKAKKIIESHKDVILEQNCIYKIFVIEKDSLAK